MSDSDSQVGQSFQRQVAALGLTLSAAQLDSFSAYLALLLDWNQRINLTAVREPEAIQTRHFYDALTCAPVMGPLNSRRLIDVGTGAGFPGLPLKILYPDCQLTLVESVQKKTLFLEAVVAELGLTAVTILAERIERLGQQAAHREQYDWVVARGVAEMRVLAEYCLPLCRLNGHMLAQKGENARTETVNAARAIETCGGGSPVFQEVQLPQKSEPHYLVVIKKIEHTPPPYPRRVGVPAKRPLT